MTTKKINVEVNLSADDEGFDVTSSMDVNGISMKELIPLAAYHLHASSLLIQLIQEACIHDEELASTVGVDLEIDLLTDSMKVLQWAMARFLMVQGVMNCACDSEDVKTTPQHDPGNLKDVHTISQLLARNESPQSAFSIGFRFFPRNDNDEEDENDEEEE